MKQRIKWDDISLSLNNKNMEKDRNIIFNPLFYAASVIMNLLTAIPQTIALTITPRGHPTSVIMKIMAFFRSLGDSVEKFFFVAFLRVIKRITLQCPSCLHAINTICIYLYGFNYSYFILINFKSFYLIRRWDLNYHSESE